MTRIAVRRGRAIRRIVVPPEALAWEGAEWAVTRLHLVHPDEWGRTWVVTHRRTGYVMPGGSDLQRRSAVRLARRLDQHGPVFRTVREARRHEAAYRALVAGEEVSA